MKLSKCYDVPVNVLIQALIKVRVWNKMMDWNLEIFRYLIE